jgi:hypothetical protein
MMIQLSLRLIAAEKHPLHDFFIATMEAARSVVTKKPGEG